MLVIKFEPGKPGMVMAGGTLAEILTELSYGVKGIYEQMKQSDETGAMLFKEALKAGVKEENGPVWGGEMPPHFGMSSCTPVKGE